MRQTSYVVYDPERRLFLGPASNWGKARHFSNALHFDDLETAAKFAERYGYPDIITVTLELPDPCASAPTSSATGSSTT